LPLVQQGLRLFLPAGHSALFSLFGSLFPPGQQRNSQVTVAPRCCSGGLLRAKNRQIDPNLGPAAPVGMGRDRSRFSTSCRRCSSRGQGGPRGVGSGSPRETDTSACVCLAWSQAATLLLLPRCCHGPSAKNPDLGVRKDRDIPGCGVTKKCPTLPSGSTIGVSVWAVTLL